MASPVGPHCGQLPTESTQPRALESEVGAHSHVPTQALPVQHPRLQRGWDPGGWTREDPQPPPPWAKLLGPRVNSSQVLSLLGCGAQGGGGPGLCQALALESEATFAFSLRPPKSACNCGPVVPARASVSTPVKWGGPPCGTEWWGGRRSLSREPGAQAGGEGAGDEEEEEEDV